jgi:hypothetical protein
MMADLAVIHPKPCRDRAKAEDAIFWLRQANRTPTGCGSSPCSSTKTISAAQVGQPQGEASPRGRQPPSPQWEIAQAHALRRLAQDPPMWFRQGLARRNHKVDVTMDSMMGGGLALLGMTLRALNVGAADGFAQWGDPKAYPKLTKFIEDPMENEQGRIEACFALSWVATDENLLDIVKRVHEFKSKDPKKQFIRACYLEALLHKPIPSASAGLVDMIDGRRRQCPPGGSRYRVRRFRRGRCKSHSSKDEGRHCVTTPPWRSSSAVPSTRRPKRWPCTPIFRKRRSTS